MSASDLVFRHQLAQFRREKGMLVFYGLAIIGIGVLVPLLMQGVETALTMAALLSVIFLKPILAESLAGEREQRSLETLLSSPLDGRHIVWGKSRFSFCFAMSLFGFSALCAALTNRLTGCAESFSGWHWAGILAMAAFHFSALSLAGVYLSATSADMRTAHSRISVLAYPLGILFCVAIAVLAVVDSASAWIVSCAMILLDLGLIIAYGRSITGMKQSDYFENLSLKEADRALGGFITGMTPRSPLGSVFSFELKYMLALKTILFSIVISCLGPALVVSLAPLLGGELDLNLAVLTTVMAIPRVPMNMIAYSVGGEKVYKTGESLLSTPLHIGTVFLAKCLVPLLVSAAMLIVSSLLTLIGVPLAAWAIPGLTPIGGYTAGQLALIFPVGLLSAMLMMLLSAVFSLALIPRHGLYVSSFLSFLFVVPVWAILYHAPNVLFGAAAYALALLIGNLLCLRSISTRLKRPQIMSRL